MPAGTVIPVRFDNTVSSATSRAEEKVVATVRQDVRAGDKVVIPAGSEMHGRVLWTRRPGRVKGKAALVGAVKSGGSGAAKGGAVGAAAGTGVVLATRGKDVTLPAGTRWRVRLAKPLVID